MKKVVFISICALLIFSASSVSAFNRNLSLGDRGEDVKELQVILNQSADTRLANQGPGSPGNETTYFGPVTRRAVIVFQNKYADEVLAPWGLVSGTGFVGSTTIKKLQEIATGEQEVSAKPIIESISPDEITDGVKITIKGENFDPEENTIMVNYTHPDNHPKVKSPDGKTLEFTLKTELGSFLEGKLSDLSNTQLEKIRDASIRQPQMKLKVSNKNGESNVIIFEYSVL